MFFQWEPKLLLGVDAMDDEHKGLVVKMNEIHDLVEARANKRAISKALHDLDALTRKHFAHEEAMMLAADYAGRENHQWVHKDLLTRLGGHVQAFDAGDGSVPPELFSFLRLWLTAHIQGIDRKYAPSMTRRVA